MRWLLWAGAGVLIAMSAFGVAPASAQPTQPSPPPPGPATSTSDELADMVMDVIERGVPAVPTTTPVPAPQP